MRPPGGREWKAAAKQAALANPLLAKARPGAVFSLSSGDAVTFPEERLPGHPEPSTHARRVIVLQTRERCTGGQPLTIMVIPCTASFRGLPGPTDFEIPDGENGFTKDGIVAMCALLQPVLKSDLARCEGQICSETLLALEAVVAANLGILAAPTGVIQMPERALDPPVSIPALSVGAQQADEDR